MNISSSVDQLYWGNYSFL